MLNSRTLIARAGPGGIFFALRELFFIYCNTRKLFRSLLLPHYNAVPRRISGGALIQLMQAIIVSAVCGILMTMAGVTVEATGCCRLELELSWLLPAEVLVGEVAVLGRLAVDGLGEVQVLDNHTGTHVKVVANDLDKLFRRLVGSSVGLDEDGKRLCNTNGV